MNYLVLFVCSMIIPIVNTSSVSQALISYEIGFYIFYGIFLGIFCIAVKHLNEYSTHSEPHRPALRATRSIM